MQNLRKMLIQDELEFIFETEASLTIKHQRWIRTKQARKKTRYEAKNKVPFRADLFFNEGDLQVDRAFASDAATSDDDSALSADSAEEPDSPSTPSKTDSGEL
jgi:hypothetical protein